MLAFIELNFLGCEAVCDVPIFPWRLSKAISLIKIPLITSMFTCLKGKLLSQ